MTTHTTPQRQPARPRKPLPPATGKVEWLLQPCDGLTPHPGVLRITVQTQRGEVSETYAVESVEGNGWVLTKKDAQP